MTSALATLTAKRRKARRMADPFAKGDMCPKCRKKKGKGHSCGGVKAVAKLSRREVFSKSISSAVATLRTAVQAKVKAQDAAREVARTELDERAYVSADDWEIRISVPISKVDDEKRIVYGWASVIAKDGEPVVDSQGDMIEADTLQKMAHEFISSRVGGVMHVTDDGKPIQAGEIVESMVLTKDVQKALGFELDREGWVIGYKVTSDHVWKGVKSGLYKAFSIGGKGKRIEA